MKKTKIYLAIITLSSVLASCNQTDFAPTEIDKSANKWTTTHTIAQFISEYASVTGDIFPVRSNSGAENLFSVDTIPFKGDSIVITGTVISSDVQGNIYKNIIIQDPQTGDALKISVDAGSLSGIFPIGQSISIKCNGMVIGKYGDLYQLGVLYYNDDSDTRKKGYEPGRMPYNYFIINSRCNGMPDASKIKVDTMTIAQIKASNRSIHSRLVCIKNAKFNGWGEVNFNYLKLSSSQLFFGLPKPSITGVPVAREIEDGTGKIYISTSEYAKFASKPLPSSSLTGNINAIVGWYRDKVANTGSWQMSLCSLNDLGDGFESYHNSIQQN